MYLVSSYSSVFESSSSAGLDFPPFDTSLSVVQNHFCGLSLMRIILFVFFRSSVRFPSSSL